MLTRSKLTASGLLTVLCGLLLAVAAPGVAHATVTDQRCTGEFSIGGKSKAAVCVQRDEVGKFNAVASVVVPAGEAPQPVWIDLIQCGGNGCSPVGEPGIATIPGGTHGFVPTSIVTGVHGHWYYGQAFFADGTVHLSPVIPYP